LHVEQLFLRLSGLKFEKDITGLYNMPSVTKRCKTKQAEVQIPTSSTNNS